MPAKFLHGLLIISFLLPAVLPIFGVEKPDFRVFQYITVISLIVYWLRNRALDSLFETAPKRTILFFAFCFYLTSVLTRYYAVDLNGIDFSIFDYMLVNTWTGDFGYSPVYNINHFAIHPSWTLLLLSPLKLFARDPVYLLILGSALIFAALLPLYLICKQKHLNPTLTGLILLAYLCSPFTGTVVNNGFRIEALLPISVFSFLYLLDAQKRILVWLALGALLCIKEDVAIYLFFFLVGKIIVEQKRRDVPKEKIALMAMAIVCGIYFYLNQFIVQPTLLSQSDIQKPTYFNFWAEYGSSFSEIIFNYLKQPDQVIYDISKSGVWKLYGPLFFIPVLSIPTAFASLPGIVLLGTATLNKTIYGYGQYYPLLLFCFALWGIIDVTNRFKSTRLTNLSCLALLLSPLFGAGYLRSKPVDLVSVDAAHSVNDKLAPYYANKTKICIQPVLIPHFDYYNGMRVLDWECLNQDKKIIVLAPNKDPFPLTKNDVLQIMQKHSCPQIQTGVVWIDENQVCHDLVKGT